MRILFGESIGAKFRALRVRALLGATLVGWAAAMVATLPMEVDKIASNAIGTTSDLTWSLAAGTAIWGLWSLGFILLAALLGGVPLLLSVREDWLLGHGRRSVAISALLGWAVVLVKFQVWMLLLPDNTLSWRIFVLYSLLFAITGGVATAVYLRIVARSRAPSSGSEPPTVGVNLKE